MLVCFLSLVWGLEDGHNPTQGSPTEIKAVRIGDLMHSCLASTQGL